MIGDETYAREPPRCPYCGSIENDGCTCNWCLSDINEEENYNGNNQNDD